MLYLVSLLNTYLATLKREEGQGMVEYVLIIALVAIVVALAFPAFTDGIEGVLEDIVTSFG
jgi:Flp pilus assembly pilin Flp